MGWGAARLGIVILRRAAPYPNECAADWLGLVITPGDLGYAAVLFELG